jgi:glycerophosphoryl diester phosphodiesterase
MERQKKKHKGLKVLLCVIIVLAVFMAAINIIPGKKAAANPFLKAKDALPMIAAHRGGGISNPENTLMAFRAAVNEYGIQICETDLWMTADGHLVYSHDSSINRVACPEDAEKVVIAEHTLEELRAYNMGYNFKDPESGRYIYRDLTDAEQAAKGLKILEFHELLEEFYGVRKDLLFIVEIKNDGEQGFAAADIIDRTLAERFPDYRSNLVVGTFHPAIEDCLQKDHPGLMRGASTAGAAKFIISQLLRVNPLFKADFSCLQIPMSYNIKGIELDLTRKTIIDRAHRRGIAVQFWTINEEEDMRALIELGADAIMTDDPQLLKRVLDSYR